MNVFMMRPDRFGVFDICQKRTVGQSSASMNLIRCRLELEMTDEQFHVGFSYITIKKQLQVIDFIDWHGVCFKSLQHTFVRYF